MNIEKLFLFCVSAEGRFTNNVFYWPFSRVLTYCGHLNLIGFTIVSLVSYVNDPRMERDKYKVNTYQSIIPQCNLSDLTAGRCQ